MDFPTYSELRISLCSFSFAALLVTILVIIIIGSTSIQTGAFQQVAGPVIININPGETKSFSWGLVAANNETSMLKLYADGNGSEFLSFPESFRLASGKTNYVVGNVTIPINHPTNATLTPIIHSTISENDTTNTGGNAVNVELSKMLTITIGANNTQPIITNNLTSTPSFQKPALIGLGLLTKGTINSLITTPTTQWIASGNWSLNVNDGNATLFETKMTWNNLNGTNAHSHEFQNLRVSKPISLNQTEKNISISGLLDVGTNQRVIWKDIPSTININGKRTISISVDDNKTNQHFASQPILGVVSSFLICSDIPGPNMEVLTPCSQTSSLTSSASPLGSEAFPGVQPNLPSQSSIPQNVSEPLQQAQSQNQLTTIQSPLLSNVPTNNLSASVNNLTMGNFSTYENSTVGLKVKYPSNWNLKQGSTVNPLLDIITVLSPKSDDNSSFTIGTNKADGLGTTVNSFANNTINNYEKNVKGFQTILYNPDSALSGNPAYQLDGTYIDDSSIKRHLTENGILYNNKIYIFQFNTTESKSQDYLPIVGQIVQSVEFLPNVPESSELTNEVSSSNQSSQNCENIPPANATASAFETDPKDYNPPGEAIDRDLKTWWANQGIPSWLQIDLQRTTTLCTVEIAWNKGDERTYEFTIATTSDGITFTDVFNGKSTGKTLSYEKYNIDNSTPSVKSIKLSFTGSSSKSGWVSIKEVKLIGR